MFDSLHQWAFGVAVGTSIVALLGTGAVMRSTDLGGRLAALRRNLWIDAPLFLCGLALAAVLPTEPGPENNLAAPARDPDGLRALLFGFGALFAGLSVQAALLVGSLRSFVATHERDLATRDTIALHAANGSRTPPAAVGSTRSGSGG